MTLDDKQPWPFPAERHSGQSLTEQLSACAAIDGAFRMILQNDKRVDDLVHNGWSQMAERHDRMQRDLQAIVSAYDRACEDKRTVIPTPLHLAISNARKP